MSNPKDPNEHWPTSRLYHVKTGRPGYIMNVAKKTDEGKRVERWVAVVPGKPGAPDIYWDADSKVQASDYVIWWRQTNGYDERGKK